MSEINDYHFDTLAIRSGYQRTAEGEHGEPIFPTSSFVFNSAAETAARFSGEQPGNIYARFTNPTVKINWGQIHVIFYFIYTLQFQLVLPPVIHEKSN
jgi:O-acetylhomoserine/O-acetylserine sulfhydrylase-like pyridoxal-dependent enzyme